MGCKKESLLLRFSSVTEGPEENGAVMVSGLDDGSPQTIVSIKPPPKARRALQSGSAINPSLSTLTTPNHKSSLSPLHILRPNFKNTSLIMYGGVSKSNLLFILVKNQICLNFAYMRCWRYYIIIILYHIHNKLMKLEGSLSNVPQKLKRFVTKPRYISDC
jgi:hypothetical protein